MSKKVYVIYTEDDKGVKVKHTSTISVSKAINTARKWVRDFGGKMFCMKGKERKCIE